MPDSAQNPMLEEPAQASASQPPEGPHFTDAQLQMAVAGRLTDELAVSVATHLGQCPTCQAKFNGYLAANDINPQLLEIFDEPTGPTTEKFAAQLRNVQPRVAEFKPGDYIGPYLVIDSLGKGGFSTVYDCTDTQLGRRVAVKVLTHRKFNDSLLARLEQEARLLAKLDHPGIVRAYEIKPFHEPPFIVMERVAGGTARELLANGPLAPRLAAQMLESVARALHHAHQHGVIHRDIKPSNLLVVDICDPLNRPSADMALKLSDFGLAKPLENNTELTRSDTLIGTPAYMSPEQTRGKPGEVGLASDIYALGVVLYEFLIGNPPLVSDNVALTLRMISETEPISPRLILRQIPRDLETICLKCLRKAPEERYASAQALPHDLKRFLENRPIQARPISSAGKLYRWCKRNRPLAAALGGILVLLAALVALGINFAIVQKDLREKAEASAEQSRQTAIEAGHESDSARNVMFSGVASLSQVADELSKFQNSPEAHQLAEKAKALNRQTIELYLMRRNSTKQLKGDQIDVYFRDAMALSTLGFPEESAAMFNRLLEQASRSQPGDADHLRLISAGNRAARVIGKKKMDQNQPDEARTVMLKAWRDYALPMNAPQLQRIHLFERHTLLTTLINSLEKPSIDSTSEQIQAELDSIVQRLAVIDLPTQAKTP